MPDCHVCAAALIPGVHACVACGEPVPIGVAFDVRGMALADDDGEAAADATLAREMLRRLREAEALEHADVAGAIAVYEILVECGCPWTPPYQRLCVLYRRAKSEADEERIIRSALGMGWPEGASAWFVTRLAKLLARRRSRP
jgi:hypothetical protein